ncbi:MAG: NAD(P)-dependent oxidoreductase [Candidatus Heimdallarchaeota archaeon]|nr:NAD(P)-dependent oxidoreductase [Candidatus Heimdallarchaeota archaeon]
MVRILITGASGCTGRGVLLYLLSKGYSDIFGMVRKIPSDPIPEINYVTADLQDKTSLDNILKENEIDTIWHIAAAVHRNVKKKDFFKINYEGTKNIMQSASENRIKHFVFTSTTAVYGKIIDSPATEEHRIKPTGLYAKSKLEAEQIIKQTCSKNGMKGGTLRIPLILGKHDRHFYPVVSKLVKVNIMPVLGNPKHKVAIVHPYDIAQAMEILTTNPSEKYEDYNIVSCNESFKKLILELEKNLIGKKRFKYYLPFPIVYGAVWLFEKIQWLIFPRKQPLINREYARMMGKEWIFDCEKLNQLGYTSSMNLEDIVKDAVSDEHIPIP